MEMVPFNLLVLDAASHALLLVDGLSGQALSKMAYPAEYTPTGLAVTGDKNKAYIPAVHKNGSGALFTANLKANSFYRLPIDIPHPMQFALSPDDITIYFTGPDSILYMLDTTTLNLAVCGQAAAQTCICVGLAINTDFVYSAWETDTGGVIAIFDHNGKLQHEYRVQGIPTNIIVDTSNETILIPFTASETSGEGLIVMRKQKNGSPAVLAIQCPVCARSNGAYPCQAAIAPDGQTAYIVNEDSGSVTIVDLTQAAVVDHFNVGRSISTLNILPDTRFAVASSNMFGDLALIDLVNGRLISFTENNQDILSPIAVLPAS